MIRLLLMTVCGLLAFPAIGCAQASSISGDDDTPLQIPITA